MKYHFNLALTLILCCSQAFSASAPRAKNRPNIVLITMDTLRADHLGCYGYAEIKTPALDALAGDGLLYQNAFAQVPLTWPSHTAIMTGTYPSHNGVQDFTGQPLAPSFRTLAEALASHGYATGAVVSSFVLHRSWGLARGFQFYDDAFSAADFEHRDIALVERSARQSVDHALSWLSKQSASRPFFLWLQLYDPHSPYHPPEPYATEYKSHPYDGEIAYADAQLGRLSAGLKASHRYASTLIVFVADHGESLGEHSENEHGFFIYTATTRVPLIIKLPGADRKAARLQPAEETIAIAPAILQIAAIHDPIEKQFDSKLLPLTERAASDTPAYSETFYPFSSFGWSPLRSLATSKYHYIDAPKPELYDLQNDPGEQHNLADQQLALRSEMQLSLQRRAARDSATAKNQGGAPALDPATVEKLRALGYVAYKSPVSAQALAAMLSDPKDKVWEFNSILEATDSFQAGHYQQGAELLQQVRAKDPQMYLIPFMLGEAALRQRDWNPAKSNFQQALQLNPTFDQAMTGLARAHFELGEKQDARHWLDEALKLNPQNFRAWYELGWMDASSNPAAAESELKKALVIQPNFGLTLRELGMLEYSQRRYAAAADHLSKAVQLGVREAPVFNALGICYRQTGRLKQAAESHRQALALDSSLAEAHVNLGFTYQLLGQHSEAQREYKAACQLNQKFCR